MKFPFFICLISVPASLIAFAVVPINTKIGLHNDLEMTINPGGYGFLRNL
jgi:hypothetical protein